MIVISGFGIEFAIIAFSRTDIIRRFRVHRFHRSHVFSSMREEEEEEQRHRVVHRAIPARHNSASCSTVISAEPVGFTDVLSVPLRDVVDRHEVYRIYNIVFLFSPSIFFKSFDFFFYRSSIISILRLRENFRAIHTTDIWLEMYILDALEFDPIAKKRSVSNS